MCRRLYVRGHDLSILRSLHILLTVAISLIASSAWADWAIVGAAYKCTKNTFALHATVESSGGSIAAPPQTRPLKVGNNKISCNVAGTTVDALINLTGPGHNGICGDPGTVGIWKMKVSGVDLVEFGDQMIYCNQYEPSIASIEITRASGGVSASICRGIWKWGSAFEDIKCEIKRLTKQGKPVATAGNAP